jgi:hypothetical protein
MKIRGPKGHGNQLKMYYKYLNLVHGEPVFVSQLVLLETE